MGQEEGGATPQALTLIRMIKFRSTYILLALFLLLLAIVLFYGNEGAEKKRIQSEESKPVFQTTQVDSFDKVVFVKSQNDELTLVRKENSWLIYDDNIDPGEIDALKKSLKELPVGQKVSRNKESWDKYGLTGDEKTRQVILSPPDGVPLIHLYLGNSGPSFQSFYMRKYDEEQIYLVKSNLSQFLSYDVNRWKDKRLFTLDKTTIQNLSARIDKERWTFAQKDGKWAQITEAGSTPIAKAEDFDKYLGDLLSLKGESIEADVKKFQKADNAIDFALADGSHYIVSVSKKDDQQSFAQITGRKYLLTLSSDLSARLRPGFFRDEGSQE